jgi:hypothetical protein
MAKNSFFIRASVNGGNAGAFDQTEIDIGAYTDLGSSKPEILRIHNVQVRMSDSVGQIPTMLGDTAATASWQLCTQSQSALLMSTDRSYVSGGLVAARNPDSNVHAPTQVFEQQLLAQDFTQGYLVAVPSLYLGGLGGANYTEDVYFSVILECTTEPASKANAVALAVSQM